MFMTTFVECSNKKGGAFMTGENTLIQLHIHIKRKNKVFRKKIVVS